MVVINILNIGKERLKENLCLKVQTFFQGEDILPNQEFLVNKTSIFNVFGNTYCIPFAIKQSKFHSKSTSQSTTAFK